LDGKVNSASDFNENSCEMAKNLNSKLIYKNFKIGKNKKNFKIKDTEFPVN
jgi:hypothetical protein